VRQQHAAGAGRLMDAFHPAFFFDFGSAYSIKKSKKTPEKLPGQVDNLRY
jgi:hypothetical protein